MVKGLIAITVSLLMIKFHSKIVEQTGKFAFAEKYLGQGGTYRFVLIVAVAVFLWGVASMTGTTDLLFSPLRRFFSPGGTSGGGGGGEWDF